MTRGTRLVRGRNTEVLINIEPNSSTISKDKMLAFERPTIFLNVMAGGERHLFHCVTLTRTLESSFKAISGLQHSLSSRKRVELQSSESIKVLYVSNEFFSQVHWVARLNYSLPKILAHKFLEDHHGTSRIQSLPILCTTCNAKV